MHTASNRQLWPVVAVAAPIRSNRPPSSERTRTTVAAFAMLCAYFLASWDVRPLFFSNQNTYFVQGLQRAGVEGLQADWLSHTRAPHIVFTWLVAALQSLGILKIGVHVIEVVLYVGLVWALWILSGCRSSRGTARMLSIRFLICAAFLVLVMEPGPWNQLFNWEGLAHQFVVGGYLQPGEFGIAILVAIALLGLERYGLAIGFLVLAVVFHASYLIPCSILAATIAGDLLYQKRQREALLLLVIFGMGVGPIVLYGLSFGGDAESTTRATTLLARQIIPQHAWPAFWFSPAQAFKFGVMIVGSALAWRCFSRSVALAMTSSLLLTVLGSAYVYFSENAYVGLLFPWRASAYLYALSVFALLVSLAPIAGWLTDRVGRERTEAAFKWCAFAFAAILAVESVREVAVRKAGPDFPFAADVARLSHVDDQVIIPAGKLDLWNRFRLLAMRPTYVDSKSHPYLATEVLEWERRIDAVNALYRLPPEKRKSRCHEMGASFYVSTPDYIPGSIDGSGETGFSLVACNR